MGNYGFGSVTHGTPQAGTVSGTVLAANADRKWLLVQNVSDTDIYISLGTAAAVTAKGILLKALAGGVIHGQIEQAKGLGNVWTGPITAISSAAAKSLLITEGY